MIASAMILVQQTEQTCPKVKDFRQIYTKVSIFKFIFFVIKVQSIANAWGQGFFLHQPAFLEQYSYRYRVGSLR